MATLPYWNNDEVISSDKLNSMVQAIINGDPLAVKVSNATKNDVNQIVGYLSSLHNSAKTNLNSATSTSAFDTAYANMTALVSNKLGAYANDDTVDLYSTGIRASIITFLQAYDTMMSNDRLNNKNTDNTLGSRIDSEIHDRENADNAINNKISDMQSNGGGRNLLQGTGTASGDVANGGGTLVKGAFNGYDAVKTNGAFSERSINMKSALGRTNAKAGDWFTLSVYVKADKQINTGSLNIYRAFGNGGAEDNDGFLNEIPMQDKPITTQWQQYSWSFQINNVSLQRQDTRIEYNLDTDDNGIYWAGWILEKGTVAHEWQPAPEDIDSAIENVNDKVDANTASISKITSNGGGRNLLMGTSDDWVAKTASGLMNVTTATSSKTSVADYNAGDEFTYSVTVNNASDSDVLLEMYRCDAEGNRIANVPGYLANSDHVVPNTHHKRISCTIAIDENTWFVEHTMIAAGGTSTSKTVYLKGEMFEAGRVAHDWSPNPDEVKSQIDTLNANKLSSADANWNLVANNSKNAYNYASGSIITFPNNSSITLKDDRIIPHINLPIYLTDNLWNTDLNNLATSGEYDSAFIPSATMATLDNRPTNPDTGSDLTGDCFFTDHYAYSGTTVRAFQKIYSCDYNYVFIRSYNGSSDSWTNWSCLTPYA